MERSRFLSKSPPLDKARAIQKKTSHPSSGSTDSGGCGHPIASFQPASMSQRFIG